MRDDATPHAPPNAAGQEAGRGFSARAHRLIPGGAHTYSGGDDQSPATPPRARARGKGARVWDLEGREFVDWGMGINCVLIGHAEDAIDEAAIAAMPDRASLMPCRRPAARLR